MTKYCIEILLVILVLVLIWVPGIVYLLTGHPKFIYHDILGWHEPDKNAKIWSDGCSSHCRCIAAKKLCRILKGTGLLLIKEALS